MLSGLMELKVVFPAPITLPSRVKRALSTLAETVIRLASGFREGDVAAFQPDDWKRFHD